MFLLAGEEGNPLQSRLDGNRSNIVVIDKYGFSEAKATTLS
jgi:hypothetical protein